jgi:hypothetical protein
MCCKVLLGIWKWKQISLFWCKWYTNDPRCMYGELPHTNVGCKCSLPLDSKCQLRKFKYVRRSWKGTGFHGFKMNAINTFHGIVIVDDANRLFNGNCHNPNLRLGIKARACEGTGQEGSLGVTCHAPRECKRVWGNEPSHSQVNAHFRSWSPDGLLNLQGTIARVKTHWIEKKIISLESYWNLDL